MNFYEMKHLSRRQFLAQAALTAVSVSALPLLTSFSSFGMPENPKDFRMAVFGDSILWGVGLREENKIHSQLARWLQNEVFGEKRRVAKPLLLAHAGATIFPTFDKRERPLPASRFAEIGSSNPSIISQIDLAAEIYRRQGASPEKVELIVVNGGANNLGVQNLLLMLFPNNEVIKRAEKYCFDEMREVFSKIADTFPQARIVVVGYYQLISMQTKAVELPKSLLGLVGLRKLGALINIPFYRDRWVRDSLARKSGYWQQYSDSSLNRAVEELNEARPLKDLSSQTGLPRAFFVPAPFKPENSYAAPDTYLWKLVSWGKSNDEKRAERKLLCRLEGKKDLAYSRCVKSALGHPNVKGAQAYFEAIKNKLAPAIESFGWLEKSENERTGESER